MIKTKNQAVNVIYEMLSGIPLLVDGKLTSDMLTDPLLLKFYRVLYVEVQLLFG